jgi:transposase
MPGNTSDKTTLAGFLKSIEDQYGKAKRTWIMDRGIPTEDDLLVMRENPTPIYYLVGTPRGHLTKLEQDFLNRSWQQVRDSVQVKLLEKEGELYVLAKSEGRIAKERAMRRRRLKKLFKRLHELQGQNLNRDSLLLKLGAAKKEAGKAYALVAIKLPNPKEPVNDQTFIFNLHKDKLRKLRKKEGHYLLRSNLINQDPKRLWDYYIQLTEIEQAFKEIKQDLSVRPIYHQCDQRIEAHIFLAFIAYCLFVTLKYRAKQKAPGLTPRAILEKFASMQMVDVHLPTVDGRELILPRHTQPDQDLKLLLDQLNLSLPKQPLPRIAVKNVNPE